MSKSVLYILFLIVMPAIVYSQDILIKKDNTRQLVKVFKIDDNDIYCTDYNDRRNTLIFTKNEVAKILFRNGMEMTFNTTATNGVADTTLLISIKKRRKIKDTLSLGDYIAFNVQIGGVVQNSFSNIGRHASFRSPGATGKYEPIEPNKRFYNVNVGFNFLFGKNPYIKHLIGANYLRSQGEFRHSYYTSFNNYERNFTYSSKAHFLNLTTGLQFKIWKGFYISPLMSFNILLYANVRYSGTESDVTGQIKTITYYENEKLKGRENSLIYHTASLCPRISYKIDTYHQNLEVYFSYNLALGYRLPWYMAGICIYPFKKLRPQPVKIPLKRTN